MLVGEIVKSLLQVKAQDCPDISCLNVDYLMLYQLHGVLGRECRPEANHVVQEEIVFFNVFRNAVVNNVFGHFPCTGCWRYRPEVDETQRASRLRDEDD